jgi:hypothetical protein
MQLPSHLVHHPLPLSLTRLTLLTQQLSESEWAAWAWRQAQYPDTHGATNTFPLLWSDDNDPFLRPVVYNQDHPTWGEVSPILRHLETILRGRATKCALVRLRAGASIAIHTDQGALQRVHRCHIPVITAPGVDFIIGGDHYFLPPGLVHELNNTLPHGVINASAIDRVHLLIDILPDGRQKAS